MTKPREVVLSVEERAQRQQDAAGQRVRAPAEVVPDFASDEAAELWHAEGRPMLAGPPSGATGYTVADVRAAARSQE